MFFGSHFCSHLCDLIVFIMCIIIYIETVKSLTFLNRKLTLLFRSGFSRETQPQAVHRRRDALYGRGSRDYRGWGGYHRDQQAGAPQGSTVRFGAEPSPEAGEANVSREHKSSPPPYCSLRALGRLDEAHPH